MDHPNTQINWDRFTQDCLTFRGYAAEGALVKIDCPFCGDHKGRGWISLQHGGAGCWNAGCTAEPTLKGGAVEVARRVWSCSWGEAVLRLKQRWTRLGTQVYRVREFNATVQDWCRFPSSWPLTSPGITASEARTFAHKQWGLDESDMDRWGLRFSVEGDYAWRIIIPVTLKGMVVAFQGRTYRNGDPKYLSSKVGQPDDDHAYCGRDTANVLFGIDSIPEAPDGDIVMVEGPGDTMNLFKRDWLSVGLMGQALTGAKLGMLQVKRPKRVVVALDAEYEAQRRAAQHVASLLAWGIPAVRGSWQGAKDAGAGADLVIQNTDSELSDRLGFLLHNSQ